MRNSRTDHFIQAFYGYAALIAGGLAIWASSGQAGAPRLIDVLLAEPPLRP